MIDITKLIKEIKEYLIKIGTLDNNDIFFLFNTVKNKKNERQAYLLSYDNKTFNTISNPLVVAENFNQEIINIILKKLNMLDRDSEYYGLYEDNLAWRIMLHSAKENKAFVGSPVILLFNGEVIRYADQDEVLDILLAKQKK